MTGENFREMMALICDDVNVKNIVFAESEKGLIEYNRETNRFRIKENDKV